MGNTYKISEFIDKLQNMQKMFGDIDLLFKCCNNVATSGTLSPNFYGVTGYLNVQNGQLYVILEKYNKNETNKSIL